ncbi:unnamed protein product [Effrenium voratum]|nr:unnamed protein product [Effrenium voratum]
MCPDPISAPLGSRRCKRSTTATTSITSSPQSWPGSLSIMRPCWRWRTARSSPQRRGGTGSSSAWRWSASGPCCSPRSTATAGRRC